jgi:hypothetical protein
MDARRADLRLVPSSHGIRITSRSLRFEVPRCHCRKRHRLSVRLQETAMSVPGSSATCGARGQTSAFAFGPEPDMQRAARPNGADDSYET